MTRFRMREGILRRKPVGRGEETGSGANAGPAWSLRLWQPTAIGVGGIIGAGIPPPAGTAANGTAGPAVLVSFLVAVGVRGSAGSPAGSR